MNVMVIAVVILLTLLVVVLLVLIANYKKLSKENKVLKETLAIKDSTIAELKRQYCSVEKREKDESRHLDATQSVLKYIQEGKSMDEISKILHLPLSEIELIVKLEEIKNIKSIK